MKKSKLKRELKTIKARLNKLEIMREIDKDDVRKQSISESIKKLRNL